MQVPPLDSRPSHLDAIDSSRVVDLDVRDDLRNGRDPFARIMAARESLKPGEILRLWAIFEPAPLYGVMAQAGFEHWTEQVGDGDWRVWFYRADQEVSRTQEKGAAPRVPDADGHEDEPVILDVRGLEPPEPLVRTLEALDQLAPGRALHQINTQVPRFLLPQLDERGFKYTVEERGAGEVRVTIRHG